MGFLTDLAGVDQVASVCQGQQATLAYHLHPCPLPYQPVEGWQPYRPDYPVLLELEDTLPVACLGKRPDFLLGNPFLPWLAAGPVDAASGGTVGASGARYEEIAEAAEHGEAATVLAAEPQPFAVRIEPY